jgi:filamentous hemagglutinin family protein
MPGMIFDGSGLRRWLLGSTALLCVTGSSARGQSIAPNARPTGGTVVAGQATITQSGSTTQVVQGTDRAAVNWQQFNVGSQSSVNFQQPSSSSWTLNRVTGPDPSVIAGRITANGGVAITNPSGIVFAQGAQVNVGSLIASAAGISNENFMAGRMQFDQAPKPGARVENHGSITVADRGMAALVAPGVSNSGTIRARLGRVALAGAETYALDLAGDGMLAIDVTQAVRQAPDGSTALVTNSGAVEAPGGSVVLSAHAASGLLEDLVRNTGRVSADAAAGQRGTVAMRAEGGSVVQAGTVTARGGRHAQGGTVELRGSTATRLTAGSRTDASGGTGGGTVLVGTTGVGRNQRMSERTSVAPGATVRADATRRGKGGTIAVNSGRETVAGGDFSARGGTQGGDGGFLELSGQGDLRLNAGVDLSAPLGTAGSFLLDPTSIRIIDGGAGTVDTNPPASTTEGRVVAAASDGTLDIDAQTITSFLAGGSAASVTLQAAETISQVSGNVVGSASQTLNLYAGTGITQTGGSITIGTLRVRDAAGLGAVQGDVTLTASANAVGTLDARATGNLSFSNGVTALNVSQAEAGGALTLSGAGAMTLSGSGGPISGTSITVSGASIAVNGGVSAGTGQVALLTDGAITDGAAGAVTAGTLRIRGADDASRAGSVVLDSGAHAASTLDATSAGALSFANGSTALSIAQADASGSLVLSGGGFVTLSGSTGAIAGTDVTVSGASIAVNGGVSAGTGQVALLTDGAITDSAAGAITAGTLHIRGAADGNTAAATGTGASTVLNQGSHRVTTLDARSGGDLSFSNGSSADLVVAQAVSTAGNVGVAQTDAVGSITIGGAATPSGGPLGAGSGGNVSLSTQAGITFARDVALGADQELALNAGGTIAQGMTSGKVAAGTLRIRGATGSDASSAGAVALGSLANTVHTLDARATGDLVFHNGADALAVREAASAGGAVMLSGGALTLGTTAAPSGGAASAAIATAAGQTLTLTGDSIVMDGLVAAGGNASLTATTGGISQTAALTVGGTLTVQADRAVALTHGGNSIGTLGTGKAGTGATSAPEASFTLRTAGNLTVSGPVTVQPTDATITTPVIELASGGAMTIAGSLATGPTSAPPAGSRVRLLAGSGITQTAGTIATGGFSAQSAGAGAIQLNQANGIASIEAIGASVAGAAPAVTTAGLATTSGNIALRSASALTVGADLQAGGAAAGVDLAATSLMLGSTITAAGQVRLLTTGGAITQTAGTITAGSLAARAVAPAGTQADISLTGANAIAAVGAIGTDVAGAATGADTLGLSSTNGNILLNSESALTLGAAASAAGLAGGPADPGIEIAARGLILNADITADRVRLLAKNGAAEGAGSIIQTGGTITADGLAALARGQTGTGLAAISLTGPNQLARIVGLDGTIAGQAITAEERLRGAVPIGLSALGISGDLTLANARALALEADLRVTAPGSLGSISDALTIEAATPQLGDSVATGGRMITLDTGHNPLTASGDVRIASPGGTVVLAGNGTDPVIGAVDTSGGPAACATCAPGGNLVLTRTGNYTIALPGAVDSLTVTATGAITQNTALQVGTLSVQGSSVALDNTANSIARLRDSAATGDFSLTSTGRLRLTGAAAGRAVSGSSVTLTADDMDIRAPIQAPGGTVRLQPLTAGRRVEMGAQVQDATSLSLSRNEILGGSLTDGETAARIQASRLVIGSAMAGAVVQGEQALAFDSMAGAPSTLRVEGASLVQSGALDGAPDARTNIALTSLDGLASGALGVGSAEVQAGSRDAGSAVWLGADNRIGMLGGVTLSRGLDAGTQAANLPTGIEGDAVTIRLAPGRVLTVGGTGVAAPTSGRVTLIADDLSLNAPVSAPGGTVEIAPRTAGRGVMLGAENAAALSLNGTELAQIATGILRIGRSGDLAVTTRVGDDSAAIGRTEAGATAAERLAGGIELGGDVDLTGHATRLELFAGTEVEAPTAGVTQTAGALSVAELAGSARGAVSLAGRENAIGTLAARPGDTVSFRAGTGATTAGDAVFDLRSADPLTIAGLVSAGVQETGTTQLAGGTLRLRAPDMEINAGLVAPGGAVVLAPSGGAAIALGGTQSGALNLSEAELQRAQSGALVIGQFADGLSPLSGAAIGTGDVTSGAISLLGPISLTQVGELRFEGTSLVQAAGPLSVGAVSGRLSASVDLTGDNAIGALRDMRVDGSFAFRNAAGRLLAVERGESLARATGLGVGAGQTATSGLAVGTGQNVTLVADGLTIADAAGGTMTIQAPAGTVRLSPRSAGASITLGADAAGFSLTTAELASIGGTGAGGTINPVSLLRIGAAGDGTLSAGSGGITILGDLALRDPAADAAGAVGGVRVNTLELAAAGVITEMGAGRILAPSLAARGGTISLDGANQLDTVVQATADGSLTLPGGAATEVVDGQSREIGLRAEDRLLLSSERSLVLQADAVAGGNATLRTGNGADLTLPTSRLVRSVSGTAILDSGARLSIQSGAALHGAADALALANRASGSGAGLANDGLIQAGGLAAARASGDLTNNGEILGGSAEGTAGGTLANSGVIRGSVVSASGQDVRNVGTIEASTGAVTVTAMNHVATSGRIAAARDVTVIANGPDTPGEAALSQTAGTIQAGNAIRLFAPTGSILQSDGAALLGGTLSASAGAGIDLRSRRGGLPANQIGALAGLAAGGGDARLVLGGNLTASGTASAAGVLSIEAGGALSASGLTASGMAGASLVAGTDLLLSDSSLGSAAGSVTASAATGALTLMNSNFGAAGGLALGAAANISASGGALSAGQGLSVHAGGTVTLTDTPASTSAGELRLSASSGSLTLTRAPLLASGGAISLAAGSGLSATGAVMQAGGGVALSAGGDLGLSDVTATAGTAATLSARGTLSMAGTTVGSGTDALLQAGGDLTMTGGSLTAGRRLGAVASGRLALTGTTVSTGGSVTLAAMAGGVSLTQAPISAGGSLSLIAGGGLLASGARMEAGGDAALAAGQDLVLDGETLTAGGASTLTAGASIRASDMHMAAGAASSLRAGGDLYLSGSHAAAGQGLVLASGGTLSLTDSQAVAGTGDLALSAASGGLTLTRAPLLATGGTISVTAGGGLSATGAAMQAGGAVALSAGGDLGLANETITAGSNVTLSNSGFSALSGTTITAGLDARQTSGLGFALSGSVLEGGRDLDIRTNGTGLVSGGHVAAGNILNLVAEAGLALRSTTISAETLLARSAGGVIELDGLTAQLGGRALFSAPAGIAAGAPSQISPRGSARPLLVFDSRPTDVSEAFQQRFLTLQPDRPGVSPDMQPTQVSSVRGPGNLPGPRAVPGGTVRLNLQAGSSPVFLLLDGGSASGTLDAGRLGVSGTGGEVSLQGTLGALDGSEAARLGNISLQLNTGGIQQPEARTRYRFNQCVLGSINCTVLTVVQPITNPLAQLVTIRLTAPARDPDALLPNVTEEDY